MSRPKLRAWTGTEVRQLPRASFKVKTSLNTCSFLMLFYPNPRKASLFSLLPMLSFPSSNLESWGHTVQIKITIDLPLYSSSCSSIHSHPAQVLHSAPEPPAIKSCLPICPLHDFLSSLTIIAPDQVPSIFFPDLIRYPCLHQLLIWSCCP